MSCVCVCASVRKREHTVCGGGRAAAASGGFDADEVCNGSEQGA